MQKFGEGQVEQPDPQDPQGVPVDPQPGMHREGAAQDPEAVRRELQEENEQADAAPEIYPQGDQG